MDKSTLGEWMSLLGKAENDLAVQELVLASGKELQIDDQLGFIELTENGISVALKQGGFLKGLPKESDKNLYYVYGLHFHSAGHEGHNEYQGALIDDIKFRDSEREVQNKLTRPSKQGGGNFSTLLKRSLQKWVECSFENRRLRFTFSSDGELELVTIF